MAYTLAKKMDFPAFLASLTDAERNFIAGLDYEEETEAHRKALDLVIERGGFVTLEEQCWYPYEPVKLGVWVWKPGHEREFVACVGIVLTNMVSGDDVTNEWDYDMRPLRESWDGLEPKYRAILAPLVDAAKQQANKPCEATGDNVSS